MARRNKKRKNRSRRRSGGGSGWKLFRPSTWHWFPRWVFYIGMLVIVVKVFRWGRTKYQENQAKKAGKKDETTKVDSGAGGGGVDPDVKSVIKSRKGFTDTSGAASDVTKINKGGSGGALAGSATTLMKQGRSVKSAVDKMT